MTNPAVVTSAETSAHDVEIETIHANAFGPGRFARAAFRIREGGPHDRALSRVATIDGKVVASVRLTSIVVGDTPALLLGPLAVKPEWKNLGIGRALMKESLDLSAKAGHALVVLVGDEPYYGPFGFKVMPARTVEFPAPVDQQRILACELVVGSAAGVAGKVRHALRALPSFAPPHGSDRSEQESKAQQAAEQR
ncbi:MAG: GNAT family N-acetyltransferase [Rhizobiaceae bacterium]